MGSGQKPRGEREAESEKIWVFFPDVSLVASGARMEPPASLVLC